MTPRERIRRYSLLGALGAVVIWALLCFLIVLSPRLSKLRRASQEAADSQQKLAEMQKEIENARIAGAPVGAGARFEKFGILSSDEEQLFLKDLIAFCRDTSNVLNLIRRSEYVQPAPSTTEQGPQARRAGTPGGAQAPQPIIERVPHVVTFSGTFLSSFYLLRKLETYKRLLTVERVQLATDNVMGYPRTNGDITIDLYLAKQPLPAPPSATAPSPSASSGGT